MGRVVSRRRVMRPLISAYAMVRGSDVKKTNPALGVLQRNHAVLAEDRSPVTSS